MYCVFEKTKINEIETELAHFLIKLSETIKVNGKSDCSNDTNTLKVGVCLFQNSILSKKWKCPLVKRFTLYQQFHDYKSIPPPNI